MSGLSKEQIRQRLRIRQVTLGTSRVDLFPSAVPERKLRYVIGIWINGDGASRTVEIEKTEEDGSHTMLFDNVPVPPADQVPVPKGWNFDIENPFMVCEGGTNLTAVASAGSPECTVIYWDDIER